MGNNGATGDTTEPETAADHVTYHNHIIFPTKKNLSNHSVLHFFWVNPRVWNLGSAPYDGYFLFTHLFLQNSHRFPPRFRPSEADEYHAWSSTRHSIWYLKLWTFTMASFEKVWNQWSLGIDLWTLKHDRMFQRSGCDGWWTKMEQGCWGDVVLVSALIKERFLCYCMSQYMSTTQLATSPPKWSIAKASQICKNPIPSHVSNRNINIHQIIMGSSRVVFPNKSWGLETPFWTHKCQGTEGQNHLTTTTTLSWLGRFRISTFKAP